MKRFTPVFLFLAAMGIAAAKAEEEKTALRPPADERQVVPEERAALAKLRGLNASYEIAPTGHITDVQLISTRMNHIKELDLGFLSDLSHLQKLGVGALRIPIRGTEALLKLDRLTQLGLSGFRDEDMAVVGRMQQLRVLILDAPGLGEAGMAQIEKLRGLERLELAVATVDDACLQSLFRAFLT